MGIVSEEARVRVSECGWGGGARTRFGNKVPGDESLLCGTMGSMNMIAVYYILPAGSCTQQ